MELMEGWTSVWWVGRTVSTPLVVMVTYAELGTERSWFGLMQQPRQRPGPICSILEIIYCRLLCWVGVDFTSGVTKRVFIEIQGIGLVVGVLVVNSGGNNDLLVLGMGTCGEDN